MWYSVWKLVSVKEEGIQNKFSIALYFPSAYHHEGGADSKPARIS